nr:nucleic acid-binding, OB-fold protein [Tanacetum cinerariifolium]
MSLKVRKITRIDILVGKGSEFPEHHFEFVAYNQLASRITYKDENSKMIYPLLTDYLGCLRSIGEATPIRDSKTEQNYLRKLDIKNTDGNVVEFAMWDEVANNFNKESIEKLAPLVTIVVSLCKVTKYRDLQLTATSATHYYINPHTPEAQYLHTALEDLSRNGPYKWYQIQESVSEKEESFTT